MKHKLIIVLVGVLVLMVMTQGAARADAKPDPGPADYTVQLDCRSLTISLPNVPEGLESVRAWVYVAKPGGKYYLKMFVWDGYRGGIGSITAPADADFLDGSPAEPGRILLLTVDGTINGERFTLVTQIATDDNIILASCLPKSLDISRMQ